MPLYLLITFRICYAQQEIIEFSRCGTKEGLSQNQIITIIQDADGYMWFGSWFGLERFDGNKFYKYFSTDKENTLCSLDIYAMANDSKGRLWIGTGKGLNLYIKELDCFKRYLISESSNTKITCLYTAKNGDLWAACQDGLKQIIFNEVDLTIKTICYRNNPSDTNSLYDNHVGAITEDSDGCIWLGFNPSNKFGFDSFDPKSKLFTHHRNLTNNEIMVLFTDSKSNIWSGSWNGGLCRYNKKKDISTLYYHKPDEKFGINNNIVLAFCQDISDNIWVGTRGGGVCLYNYQKDQFTSFISNTNDPTSISNNNIYALYKDKSGVLWIGT